MRGIDISIIIVSYINLEVLIDCLNSIHEHNDIGNRMEIIVVENSPSNEIFDYVKNNYPDVTIIKNDNKGFGQANNVGAGIASGKYYLFLNPDTILIEPIFEFAIGKFRYNPKLGVFGVKLIDGSTRANHSFFYLNQKMNLFSIQLIKFFNRIDYFNGNTMYISGANLFIRKELFWECGAFDENIFMYYEEPDLINRVKDCNMTIGYFKEKRIIHLRGNTSVTANREEMFKINIRSRKYYSTKYGLDYRKSFRAEIRYNKCKILAYYLIGSDKYKIFSRYNAVLKNELDIVD